LVKHRHALTVPFIYIKKEENKGIMVKKREMKGEAKEGKQV
jgi:hypothetical protein